MKQPQGIIFVFLLIIGIVSAQRSGGGAGGGQQQQQQQPSPSAPSPSTTTETAAANSQTSSTSTSTTTSSTPTSTISTYNPPTFKMSLNTFPLAVSPLYGLSTCALSFNNMLLCSGLGADRGQNDRLGVNYTLVSPTSTLWQSGANFSSAWSLNWIAGSTTNINNSSNGGGGGGGGNATSQPFNNANISSNTQYLAMGAKRWQLGYEDQLFYGKNMKYKRVYSKYLKKFCLNYTPFSGYSFLHNGL